jgi:hypothetical protein
MGSVNEAHFDKGYRRIGAADQFMPFTGKVRPISAAAIHGGWSGRII